MAHTALKFSPRNRSTVAPKIAPIPLKPGQKRAILPRSANHARRDQSAGFALYANQKRELQRRARAANVSVSYYLNLLLWADWLS